ncbi:MAG: glycosyltransferase family 2 protein [Bacteroidales bacterium]|nr:glycosyltransferase family 2 protein [Bacteroidales bacterium]
MQRPLYSIIVSVYNEETVLPLFHQEMSAVLDSMSETADFELLFVNDGSRDNSRQVLQQLMEKDQRVRVIHFSRNFGHEAAMLAGLDHCRGEAAVCMDSDLQHPPILLPQMFEQYRQGKDVLTMMRTERADGGQSKNISSRLFYRLINKISDAQLQPGASDFFLLSQRVINVLRNDYRERTRFLRGIIQTIGFVKASLTYEAPPRAAGESKYSLWKLLKFSFTAIASFSKTPLKIGIYSGLIFVLLSIILIIYSIVMWIVDTPVSGYTTLIIFLCAFAGIQLFVTGAIGYYIGFVFDEVKQRPIYVIQEITPHE